jgi:hypothetical protein
MAARRASLRRTLLVAIALAAAVVGLARAPATDAGLTYKSYPAYLADLRPIWHQWWQGIEAWQGFHFLLEPTASNTENAAEVNEVLRQWWQSLENRRGGHFLVEPVGTNTDTTPELHSLVNQWQNAIEAWRGAHFMLEPPAALTLGNPKKVGKQSLKPKHATARVGDSVTLDVGWTVPEPSNWHDLRTIDLRACGKDSALRIRWKELQNTLRLRSSHRARGSGSGTIGDGGRLTSRLARVSLADTEVTAKGPAARKMTLALALEFRPPAVGLDCELELAAADDLGNRDGFQRAGTIQVRD